MRVIGVSSFGGPKRLEVFAVPEPEPGPQEVRIRVHAAAVNPADTMFRAGKMPALYLEKSPPFVPGMDAAGVVDKLGTPGSGRLSVGDRVVALVMPSGPHGGAYAEKIVVPAASVVPLPAGADFAAASTLLMNAATARICLNKLGLEAGRTLAVTGAAGAVGGYAIQLAKEDGLYVIADSSPEDEALVLGLGADCVVRRGGGFAQEVRSIVRDGVDGLVDAGVMEHLALPAIADTGRMAVIRGWEGPSEREISIHQTRVRDAALNTAMLEDLSRKAAEGVLSLRVAEVVPAADAGQAHSRIESGGQRGRLVLDFTVW